MLSIVIVFTVFLIIWCVVFQRPTFAFDTPPPRISNDDNNRAYNITKLRSIILPKSVTSRTADETIVDCVITVRFCTAISDCSAMCTKYEDLSFQCDTKTHICRPSSVNNNVRVSCDVPARRHM